jgi:type IV pilus assembly protein PilB
VDEGLVSEAQVEEVLQSQAGSGLRLGELVTRKGWVEPETTARLLAGQLLLPYRPPPLEPEPAAADLVDEALARRRRVLPLSLGSRSLQLAMEDPLDVDTVRDLRFRTGRRVEPLVVSTPALEAGLDRAYGGEVERLVAHFTDAQEEDEEAGDRAVLERAARSAPVVRLVDRILADAVAAGASDIHVETGGDGVRVRVRVDGLLRETLTLPRGVRGALVSRLKIMAGMDIAVRRRPQDGGLALELRGRSLALRVSTLPATGGEKTVVRILDPGGTPQGLHALGLAKEEETRLRRLLQQGQGVILAAGPTGSGKSSTLQAALREVGRVSLNIVTLEDPVECRIPGVTHVQVAPRAGLTFPAALRAVLRQDPDVIMVGEIRDRETAEIAMAAAVTGHLVLSTVHTTDAPGALTRLLHMGVPPFLVAGGLTGVVAQRLVRRFCTRCRGSSEGCAHCHGGFRGRTGVFQVLEMNEALREAVVAGTSAGELRRLAREAGMGSLSEDARRVVAEGLTAPHEVGRVVRGDPGAGRPCRGCGSPVPQGASGCPWCGRRAVVRCRCGVRLERGWRWCPGCQRPARPAEESAAQGAVAAAGGGAGGGIR